MRLLLQLVMMYVLFLASTAEKSTRKGVSDRMLRWMYLASGRFENTAQRTEDEKYKDQVLHDPAIIDCRPVMVTAFPSEITFLFMVTDFNELVRLEIFAFSEDSEGDIKVTRHCIPNISKYTMDTFDPTILQTLKFEDFQNCCVATISEIERNSFFGFYPDCHLYNFEKRGHYPILQTCGTYCFFASLDAPQGTNPVPYVMNVTKRYPLSVLSPVIGEISATYNPCTGV